MKEREVEFQITGFIGRYKGFVVAESGYGGRPEIQVTHHLKFDGWHKVLNDWPLLKDGDYIFTSEKLTPV
jgi:hypothetical protein